MDTKGQISDLPEPKPSIRSQSEDTARQWQLFVVFIQFVTFYSFIHKLFIPLFLSFTSLKHSPYSEIQISLILPLSLSFCASRAKSNNAWFSFLCGMAIYFGIDEIYATAIGRHTGWFAFSRLLSSIPMAIACGFAMSKSAFKPNFKMAWIGALTLFALSLFYELQILNKKPNPMVESSAITESRALPSAENMECGAQTVEVQKGRIEQNSSPLTIKSCGFSPSIYLVSEGKFDIENQTDTPINLHLIVFEKDKKRTVWNILIRAKEKRSFDHIDVDPDSVGMLYSDSSPQFGISVLRTNPITHSWNLTRKPIVGRQIEEKAP